MPPQGKKRASGQALNASYVSKSVPPQGKKRVSGQALNASYVSKSVPPQGKKRVSGQALNASYVRNIYASRQYRTGVTSLVGVAVKPPRPLMRLRPPEPVTSGAAGRNAIRARFALRGPSLITVGVTSLVGVRVAARKFYLPRPLMRSRPP